MRQHGTVKSIFAPLCTPEGESATAMTASRGGGIRKGRRGADQVPGLVQLPRLRLRIKPGLMPASFF
jgi:hypothetical protein